MIICNYAPQVHHYKSPLLDNVIRLREIVAKVPKGHNIIVYGFNHTEKMNHPHIPSPEGGDIIISPHSGFGGRVDDYSIGLKPDAMISYLFGITRQI